MKSTEPHSRQCVVCGKFFCTTYSNKRTCSFECKEENNRIRARARKRMKQIQGDVETFRVKRKDLFSSFGEIKKMMCSVCGFDKTVDLHHVIPKNQGGKDAKNLLPLCPNHHAMYHRGLLEIVVD